MSIASYLSRFKAASIHPDPAESLNFSQLAPSILNTSSSDTPEQWSLYEALLLSTLRTGDDSSARLVLQRLSDRFGNTNARIMALQGLFDEATAKDHAQLEEVLRNYEVVLQDDPANLPIAKRRITLLNHLNRPQEAITALTFLVSLVPTDAESWSQLAQFYFQASLFSQCIYCLEEILLILPNAYNVHARLGEVSFVSATTSSGNGVQELQRLEASVKWYLRSIELCDNYLRGYYGLKLVTSRLTTSKISGASLTIPEEKLRKLNSVATVHLQDIVEGYESGRKGFTGYDRAEIQAAKELLGDEGVLVGS